MSLRGDRYSIPDTTGSVPPRPRRACARGENAENCEAATGIPNDGAHVGTHPQQPVRRRRREVWAIIRSEAKPENGA
ncbi:Hypp7440 [Branchiostoma lanceolatum]|uniref:Hypp7440 protein n=1 Tax=Branchiostoma lanceolatum TaxID=7740 RepID=A0A8J9Z092_BRALA|nr:Hypp7440 [Branchiostoma lanceolatum]